MNLPFTLGGIISVAGLLLVSISFLSDTNTTQYALAAGGAVATAVGTSLFTYARMLGRESELEQSHKIELQALREELKESGQQILIQQYANDTAEAMLIQATIDDIASVVERSPGNAEAIKAYLSSVERIQYRGFFSKASELATREEGFKLLEKFVHHLRHIADTSAKVPSQMIEKLYELESLLDETRKKKALEVRGSLNIPLVENGEAQREATKDH